MPRGAQGPIELLKQQRLPAWQPILTPLSVAVAFFILGVIFVPLGVLITLTNQRAKELSVRYDHVQRCTSTHNTGAFTYTGNGMTLRTGCITEVYFELRERLVAPVYLYYELTKFYQNHRRYSKSRSDAQLAGAVVRDIPDASPLVTPGEIKGLSGTSIRYMDGLNLKYKDFVYAPAGLIAWSMFNDTFTLYAEDNEGGVARQLICNTTDFSKATNLPLKGSTSQNMCTKKGIAWDTDVAYKYKAPNLDADCRFWTAARELYTGNVSTKALSNDTFFNKGWYAGELGHTIPVTTDEDLMVWMRPASLPTFRKLHRVIHTDLPPGRYLMLIGEHFDVSSFGGTKSFVLATLSWLGGKNVWLQALYLSTGGFSVIFAVVLLLVHRFCGDRASKAIDALIRK
ncbi:hypothetical protein TraAM80_03061 [Trypanosoma rangeli]|uniref:ALA-interacting subunit n=1 Tax=Trypanosoma rangeli TaxID=5698 RepID=A0A422NR22_TRYRA|nr:uncharacterized protein TraAM80_03061 [Trypanosoma rangeli]RNF07913.1 hypothetical protein TraAM80_03061 [Trypanosoma rangeli]|eukprot:RNF07913.1 hypothetical protein TraAM80_03061 [Trypanosoma rangeli]